MLQRFLLLLTVFCFSLSLRAGDAGIEKVFVQRLGQSTVSVLRLKSDKVYEYCRYTKKKISRDVGRYNLQRGKLKLTSETKGAVNPLKDKTLYISREGLHNTRYEAMTFKGALMSESNDPEFRKDWSYNPITKNLPVIDAEKGKLAVTTENTRAIHNSTTVIPAEYDASNFVRNYYVKLAGKYAPAYGEMLKKAYCGPDCYSTVVNGEAQAWSKDTTNNYLFSEYETTIHESVHHYNTGTPRTGYNYLVLPGLEVKVPPCTYYKSNEFTSLAPADAKDKIFRYDTYIGENSRVSANQWGIFGLLEEYSAYANGVRACLVASRTAAAARDTVKAKQFLAQATGTYYSHYEFRLFVGWYLHYAQQHHPEIYKDMMSNTNLRLAYTLIDQEFATTIKGLDTERKKLKSYGLDYGCKEYIGKLLKTEQVYLDQFMIKGATVENYKTYVKS